MAPRWVVFVTSVRRGLGFEPMDVSTQPAQRQPSTHLVGSAVVAALLFLPTGVIALAFAWRTRVWNERGDFRRARRSSRAALSFMIISIVLGVAAYAAILVGLLALGAFSGG